MESIAALNCLSALAHEGRLAIFRLLVKAGPDGMAAGDIARSLAVAPNTLSAQLLLLSNARLVRAQRQGRSIIYAAQFDQMSSLLLYLTQDCCNGRPEICAPLAKVAQQCCPPRRKSSRSR